MIISWKKDEKNKPIQTEKAFGIKLNIDGTEKIMWIPKSQIKNRLTKKTTMVDIPDWLYDKKIDELIKDSKT